MSFRCDLFIGHMLNALYLYYRILPKYSNIGTGQIPENAFYTPAVGSALASSSRK